MGRYCHNFEEFGDIGMTAARVNEHAPGKPCENDVVDDVAYVRLKRFLFLTLFFSSAGFFDTFCFCSNFVVRLL